MELRELENRIENKDIGESDIRRHLQSLTDMRILIADRDKLELDLIVENIDEFRTIAREQIAKGYELALDLHNERITELTEIKRLTDAPKQITIPENILEELQRQGFIEDAKSNLLKWKKSKSLLAYFVDVANDKLSLKHGEKRTIKPFETLFGVDGLTSAINDYKKTGGFPVGYKDIDKLFP